MLVNTYTIIGAEWKDELKSRGDEEGREVIFFYLNTCWRHTAVDAMVMTCTDWSDTLASPYKPHSQRVVRKGKEQNEAKRHHQR